MKLLYTLLIFVFCINSISAQTFAESFPHDGGTRWYRIHLPPGYSSNSVLPVVLNFHGLGSNAQQQQIYSQFNNVADTAHIIVVYPEAVDNIWNVGFGGSTDDVSYTNDLIDTLQARYNIDVESVFSTGMSNGGYMSYKLACDLTHRIQAIASVTGSMVPDELSSCNPSDQIPVMQIHGTEDPTVEYYGSFVASPIENVVAYWAGHDNCEPANVVAIEDVDPNDGCTAERFDYLICDGDNEVVFYKVTGGEHTWPGAPIPIGITCQDFKASDEIWKFFYKYRSPNVFYADSDGDGYAANEDCNDSNPDVNPGQTEIAYNGLDDDCNPNTPDDDLDNDGFPNTQDCDDNNAAINPNGIEIPLNEIDEDCDGMDALVSTIEINEAFVTVYPNPAKDEIFFNSDEHVRLQIQLFDIHGKLILDKVVTSQVDVSNFSKGTYLLKITDVDSKRSFSQMLNIIE